MDYSDESQHLEDADAHARAGRWLAAVQVYREVTERKPKDLLLRQKLAEALARAGQTAEAVSVLASIADRLARDGMLLRAITIGKLILEMDPSHTQTQQKVAELYARKHGVPPPPSFFPPRPPPPVPVEDTGESQEVSGVIELLEVAGDIVKDAAHEQSGEGHAELASVPHSPLFADLDEAAFLDVVKTLALRRAAQGKAVLVEGDAGTSMFIIVRGDVVIERARVGAPAQVLHTLGPGAFFGEMALLTHAPRMATVRAKNDVVLLELDEPRLRALMEKHPSMQGVMEGFHRRRMVANLSAVSPIFQAMEPAQRRELLEKFETVVTVPGQLLIEQWQTGDGLYLILRGRCDVTADEDGAAVNLPAMKEGEIFGEVSLIYDTPCTATVKAAGDGVVLRLRREDFRAAIPPNSAAMALIRKLGTERLKRFGMDAVLE